MVFPEGDVSALSAALRRLHDNPSVAANWAVKGRARVLGNFTHRRVAEETAKFYEKVLSRSGAGSEEQCAKVTAAF